MKLCNSAVMLMASLSENAYIETSRFQELYIFAVESVECTQIRLYWNFYCGL